MLAPFNRAFNVATIHLANRMNPRGWGVAPAAPNSLETLRLHVAREGRITVYSGGSEATIYGDPEVNYAARAWHAAVHLFTGYPFTFQGERMTARTQAAQLNGVYGETVAAPFIKLLYAEIVGQSEYASRDEFGRFPADQREFVRLWMSGNKAAALRLVPAQ